MLKKRNTVSNLIKFIRQKNATVSCAESITGGRIQAYFTESKGVSDVFKGGICAYSMSSKVELLSVDAELAKQTNCVHEQIAVQMAVGCSKKFDSTISIATTGYESEFEFNGKTMEPIAHVAVHIDGSISSNGVEATYTSFYTPLGVTREDRLNYIRNASIMFVEAVLRKQTS